MIEIRKLVKHHGAKTAVDGLDFTVEPGTVTGFLGPNGAGKSTTMRLIVGRPYFLVRARSPARRPSSALFLL